MATRQKAAKPIPVLVPVLDFDRIEPGEYILQAKVSGLDVILELTPHSIKTLLKAAAREHIVTIPKATYNQL